MALDTAVDSNVLLYPVLVFMKEQGVAEPPKELGPHAPIVVLTDLG